MAEAAPSLSLAEQQGLVAALFAALRSREPEAQATLVETHISYVLLVGARAYKIKKAVNPGFLDFTTPALRRFYCDEELRLNRRTAPALYVEVLPVTGSIARPRLGGAGPPLDWVLVMRAFAQDGLWDRLAARGALLPVHVDALAASLVAFHHHAAQAAPDCAWGQPPRVRAPLLDTLRALRTLCTAAGEQARIDTLARREAAAFGALQAVFAERLRQGFVRECHGDLHLGNVTLVDGRTTMFDALEFSSALRWTDVMSDVAFMAMDLHAHGLARLAHRFVNAWVEGSGDVAGLRVLRYHGVYRALVRARVAALRRDQAGQAHADVAAVAHYLDVALAFSRPAARPALIITHGCSGSGKTLATQSLLELCGAIRLRADVERKRLFGLPALAHSDPASKTRLYAPAATQATQARLREAAALALASGCAVILDATFLAYAQRRAARALARRLGVPFVIVDFQASAATLRERVVQRLRHADDASEADLVVLQDQLAQAQALRADEAGAVLVYDAEPAFDEDSAAARWAPLLQRLRA